ncbi:ATP-binding protein [Streptomyces sp. NPDC007907]|uniref:ATP-binding protein n=1 Tax=Streptomyces sp. NPDC007907 TaxID=3364789 RepID=UPI0036E04C38
MGAAPEPAPASPERPRGNDWCGAPGGRTWTARRPPAFDREAHKQTFTDPLLCTALVDRVTFNAHIVETGTDSFRFKKTQEKHRKS